MVLGPDAKKALDRLEAKLDLLNKELAGVHERVDELAEYDEKVGKVVEDKVFEIKGVLYIVLVIVAVLLALVLGALLRAYFG